MEPTSDSSHVDDKTSKETLYETKIDDIVEACKWKDVKALRLLAVSNGGLVNDELRREACRFRSHGLSLFSFTDID